MTRRLRGKPRNSAKAARTTSQDGATKAGDECDGEDGTTRTHTHAQKDTQLDATRLFTCGLPFSTVKVEETNTEKKGG